MLYHRATSHSWVEWEKRAEGDLHEVTDERERPSHNEPMLYHRATSDSWLEWEKRAEGDLHEVRDE